LTLVLAALSGGCALLPPMPPAPRAADENAAAATAQPATPPVIQLVVDAPAALRPLLLEHLDLARLQQLSSTESLDAVEWARLIAAAPAQARELLKTEGYFDAEVDVQRHGNLPTEVRVTVQPGPRTQVAALQVDAEGDLARRVDAGDAGARALLASLRAAGPLRAGVPFRNPDWSETKQRLLAILRSGGYADASLGSSQADIDAVRQRASLQVVLDSGPLFTAGPIQVEGLKVHDEATVRALAELPPGTPLTEAVLLDYQERLRKTGLFESALVRFDPEPTHPEGTPVKVRVRELPLQQATVGLGYSANTGQRATLEHTHRRLLGRAVTAHDKLELGRDRQLWSGDFKTHPGEGFRRNLLGVQIERVRSDTDVVLSQQLRLGRSQETARVDRLSFVEWLQSRRSVVGDVERAQALSLNHQLVWRDLDSVLLPTRGYTATLQGGVGQARGSGGDGPFTRLYGRLTGYLPLGSTWYGQARIEAGEVVKRSSLAVPDALGFRAGGDDSVRGYAYRSLAPVGSDGATISGNVLLTASVEVARPIAASLPSVWGALFIDAGGAAEAWSGYKASLGYGTGVRWRSPIGALRADLAWGQEVKRLRLHLSLGIAF
jgi:translocation and assembly module TamA